MSYITGWTNIYFTLQGKLEHKDHKAPEAKPVLLDLLDSLAAQEQEVKGVNRDLQVQQANVVNLGNVVNKDLLELVEHQEREVKQDHLAQVDLQAHRDREANKVNEVKREY